jgi:hypothetical protein
MGFTDETLNRCQSVVPFLSMIIKGAAMSRARGRYARSPWRGRRSESRLILIIVAVIAVIVIVWVISHG